MKTELPEISHTKEIVEESHDYNEFAGKKLMTE